MSSASLFDFKAGRVEFNESTGQATPLAGQGRVAFLRSSEDPSLLGMQWQPRGSNNKLSATEELLIVPGDVEFTHVPFCQTGRVIQMRFNSSGERHLFWLQDAPKGDLQELSAEDQKIIEKLNELANNVELDEDEDNNEDAMQDDVTSEPKAEEESLHAQSNQDQTSTAPNQLGESNDVKSTLFNGLAERLEQQRHNIPKQPLSRVVNTSTRVDHVLQATKEQIDRLLSHTQGVAGDKEELVELMKSPHFSQSLDEIGNAIVQSPALAAQLGISRTPVSAEDLLALLREAKGN